MDWLPDIARIVAIILGGGVALLLAFFLGRRLITLVLTGRMDRRVRRVQAVLEQHQREQFASIDRLLFQLGELHDLPAVENALNSVMNQAGQATKPQLVKIYSSLGLVEMYLQQLREAPRWSDRASAAHALGQLAVARAIPHLVEVMRDPHEDTRTVKLAAAKALAAMEAREAVPLLVLELEKIDEWASPRVAEVLVNFGGVAIPALLDVLATEESVNSRVWAAQILGRIGASAAESHLIALLRDRYEQVRISAAEALGRLKSRQAVNELVQIAMKDPVAPVRAEAARAIGSIGEATALESLVLLLGDPDYWSRLRAIEAIELIAPPDSSVLETTLRDPSPEIRRRAAVALERIGVLGRSIEELASTDRSDWAMAHRRLVEMGQAGLIESILAYVEHHNFRVRARIADVLGEIADPRASAALKPLLIDPQWPVRVRAVEALARLDPQQGAALLLPSLSDGEETVRAAAIRAFKILGLPAEDHIALEVVLQLFDNVNAEIRASAVEAMGQLTHPRVDQTLERALADPNAEVRLRAVQAISAQNESRWLTPLINQLGDAKIAVRIAAAEGLSRIGSRPALEAMVRSLTTPDREFREALTALLAQRGVRAVMELATMPQTKETILALVWTLGKTQDPTALPELRRLLSSTEADVRAALAGALGKIKCDESVHILLDMLGDRSERVRAATANALGSIGSPAALPKLILALKDPDAFVRHRVVLNFGRIGGDQGLAALDYARGRFTDHTYQAYVVAGYALCGGEIGFKKAISELANPSLQQEVERIIEREPEEVREQLHANLHLASRHQAPKLDTQALRETYARTLRTDQDAAVRCSAIEALRSLGGDLHRDLLLDAVATDPAPTVRQLALNVLADDIAGVSAAFERALRDPSLEVQIEATHGLGQTKNPQHNRALLTCFTAKEPELDQAVIAALAQNNRAHIILFLDELMGHSEENIMHGGARVLSEIADPRTTGLLKAWLGSRSVRLRSASAQALGKIGTLDSKSALISCLGDTSEEVRLVATSALGTMPGSDTLQALMSMCRDPSLKVRLALAQLVGTSRHVGIAELGETLSQDPDGGIRTAAMLSLLQLKDIDAMDRFLRLIAEQPAAVRKNLREIHHSHPVLSILRDLARRDPRPAARIATIKILPLLGQRPLELLLDAFEDPAPEVRIAAVEVAAPYKDQPNIQEGLELLLRDTDQRVSDAVRKIRLSIIGAGS